MVTHPGGHEGRKENIMFNGEKRYNVVLNFKNGGVVNTDLLFATDDKAEAVKFAQDFPDNDGVEIWTDINEDAGSYEVIEY